MLKKILPLGLGVVMIYGCQGSKNSSGTLPPPIIVDPGQGGETTQLTRAGQTFLDSGAQTLDSSWMIYQSLQQSLTGNPQHNLTELGSLLAISAAKNSAREPSEASVRRLFPLYFDATTLTLRTFVDKNALIAAINTLSS